MNHSELKKHGDCFEHADWCVVFGYRSLQLPDIQNLTSKKICILHQVHGDQLVYASPRQLLAADAHWTQEKDQLLIVKTADCIPLFIVDTNTGVMSGIHSGWRGVDQQIVLKTCRRLSLQPKTVKIFVGPHILMKSFEVQENVARSLFFNNEFPSKILNLKFSNSEKHDEFQKLTKFNENDVIIKTNDRFYINLYALSLWQLFLCDIFPQQVTFLDRDTATDNRYCSYRRDKALYSQSDQHRNYSFIFKKKAL